MGLFSFLKGSGEKVIDKPSTPEAEPLRASALLNHVKSLGIPYKKLTVKTDGSTVTLDGEVAKQEDSERIALTVGNVDGVDKVDNQLVVSEPAAEAKLYTVKSGDSLSKISKEVYGDANKYAAIFDANKPMLKDPDKIYPGQVLRIP